MGMDCWIIAARNKDEAINWNKNDFHHWDEIRENPLFYNENGDFIFPNTPVEMWYARKPYFMMDGVPKLRESYKKPYCIRLYKVILKEMIEYHAFHRDYFDSFQSLPQLCEIYQEYDVLQTQGINLYFLNSY